MKMLSGMLLTALLSVSVNVAIMEMVKLVQVGIIRIKCVKKGILSQNY